MLNVNKTREMVANFRRRNSAFISWGWILTQWRIILLLEPGWKHWQQTGLEDQQSGCTQEGDEPTLFPEEAQICSTSLLLPASCSLPWPVGGAESAPETRSSSTNWSGKQALWLAAHRKHLRPWWRRGLQTNCYPSWIIQTTLSTTHWTNSGPPSPGDSCSSDVTKNATWDLSCHTITLYNSSSLSDRNSGHTTG